MALVVVVVVVTLSYARLWFGVDVTDESFYAALSLRFVLGDQPFVDEQNVGQMGALFTVPVMWLWHQAFGEHAWVLALRHVYWIMSLLVGLLGYRVLRERISRNAALLAAFAPVSLVPYAIPAPSYNTLAVAFVALCSLLLVPSSVFGSHMTRVYLAGVLGACAATVYPPLALLFPVLVYLAVSSCASERRRAAFVTILGYATGAVPLALLLLAADTESLRAMVHYSSHTHGVENGASRLVQLAAKGLEFLRGHYLTVLVLSLIVVASAALPRSRALMALAGALLCSVAATQMPGFARSLEFWLLASPFVAALYAVTIRNSGVAQRPLLVPLAMPVVAGIVMASTSTQGLRALALGLLAAAPLVIAMIYQVGISGLQREPSNRRESVALLACAVLLAGGVMAQYAGAYRDAPISELSQAVSGGPFAGMRTTPERAGFVEQMAVDISEAAREGDRIVVFDRLPVGYILTGYRAATNSVWLTERVGERPEDDPTLAYFDRSGIEPSVAVVRTGNRVVTAPLPPDAHPLRRYVREPEWVRRVARPDYEVWVRREPIRLAPDQDR